MTASLRLPVAWVLGGWIGVTALIALNRGVDLLWGMVALLAAALVVGVLLPYLQLRLLRVRRRFPAEGVVGDTLVLEYEIDVRGPLPCYGIELHDALEPSVAGAAVFLPVVSGRKSYRLEWVPQTRGRRSLGDIVLETGFPLGLRRARRRVAVPAAGITVYPGATRLRQLPVEGGADPVSERLVTQRRGGSEEFFGLKNYRPGDDLRSVHWRATARSGELLVREFEHYQDRELWIVLDQCAESHAGVGRHSTLEYMFHIAHSAQLEARAQGVPAGLIYREQQRLQRIDPGVDAGTHARLREVLATADAGPEPLLHTWLAAEREQLAQGGTWLLFNTAGPARRQALRSLIHQRRARGLIVEFVPDTFVEEPPPSPPPPVEVGGDADCRIYSVRCGADFGQLFASR